MRTHILLILGLTAGPACNPGADTDTDTDTDSDTATDISTGAPTGGDDQNPYTLGDHASEACSAAMVQADDFLAATTANDAAAAASAYVDPLRAYIQTLDVANGRDDDAVITAALAAGDPTGAALAEGGLYAALAAHLRAELAAVAEDTPDKYAAWDEAYCVWKGGLSQLAARVDFNPVLGGFPIYNIENFFLAGHQVIAGEPPMTTIDAWVGPESIQQIEKSLLRAAHHDLIVHADPAFAAPDLVAASRARGLLAVVRDQLAGRNTPGLAAIEAMLVGDPSLLDPEFVHFELDIAFAKHARDAIDQTSATGFGTPASHTHAVAGRGYADIIASGMVRASPKIDTNPYRVDWDRYIALARTGDDDAAALAIAERLIDFTCAYQTVLGIAACTGTADEPQP